MAPPAADLTARLVELNAAYARAIDNEQFEQWPGLFLDPCLYKVTTAENVAKGLEADERVVTTGFARLTAGAAVTVTNAEEAPAPSAQPAPPPRQRRRGAEGQQRSEATPSASPSTQQ